MLRIILICVVAGLLGYTVVGLFLQSVTHKKSSQSPRAALIARVKQLIGEDNHQPLTGEEIHDPNNPYLCNWNGTGVAGVMVEDSLYYEALGIPMGTPPPGDDVKDRHPGIPDSVFSTCGRCKRSWKWVESHSTRFSDHEGMFPLCERCWKELGTPEKRLPYYRDLLDEQLRDYDRYAAAYKASGITRQNIEAEWPAIEKAVREGK